VTALTTLTKIGSQAVAAHDAQFDLPREDLERLAADLAARLREHEPVLDAGCGSGLMLVPLRGAGLEVVGVDIDVDMVSAALGREPGLRGLLAFSDLAALAVRRWSFGSVHVAYVFHLFDDARPVLDELLRVIRPGGRLVVNFGPGRQPPPDGIDVAALTQYFTAQLGAGTLTSSSSPPPAPCGPPRAIEDFVHFLASRGAVRVEDLEVLSTVGRSVNYFINRLEANPFSAPSGVSRAVLRSAADKTRAWAEARFGDLGARHPAWRLTKYLCWDTPAQ
jgi:SAM-dependent methyltransferase